jgi:predicted transcriptional regulator
LKLAEENATPAGGASIEDRLVQYLSAGTEPEQPKEPKPEPAAAEAATEAKAPVAAEESKREPDDGGKEKADEPQVTTSDLAKILGIDENALDVDDDGTIKLKTKVDGSEGTAKLADLLKSYQLEGHVNKRSMEIAEREKALASRAQEAEKQHLERLQNAEALASLAIQDLTQEYQNVPWAQLEAENPGQAALLRQKFADRNARLQGVLQNTQQQRQVYGQRQQAEAEQAKAQRLAEESQKLPTLIPEWKDDGVRAKEAKELIEWGLKAGYSQETLKRLDESSALDIATFRKAMLFDKLQQAKPAIEKQVRTAPKIVKPGQAVQSSKDDNLRDLRAKVTKTGGKHGSLEEYLIAAGKV